MANSWTDNKNYLSIIVNTKKDTKLIKNNLLKKGVNISILSDYDIYRKEYNKIIIGYTSINEDLIDDGMKEIIKEIK